MYNHPNATYPGQWTQREKDAAGYICLEYSKVYAATAQTAFDLAGVAPVVKVSCGSTYGMTDLLAH